MSTLNLTEFLLARVAEDAAAADAADALGKIADVITTSTCDEFAEHIARWHPARVLAECAAKRRIVEAFADAERAVATYDHDNPIPAYWQEWGNRHALASVLEYLALPYAEHPDFREEWRA